MVVGITGGIATGKTTVTSILRSLGAVTFSADEASRAVLTRGGSEYLQIVNLFGNKIITGDGHIDRSALASRVFASAEDRLALNAIMHPRIRRLLRLQIDSAREDYPPPALIAVEVPLLFEGNMQHWFEQTIVVTASEAVETGRLMARSGLNSIDAKARISVQMPLSQKVDLATHVVANDGNMADLTVQVESLYKVLVSRRTVA